MERRSYVNEQYPWRKCLEIADISASVADNGLKGFRNLKEIDFPIDFSSAEDCR